MARLLNQGLAELDDMLDAYSPFTQCPIVELPAAIAALVRGLLPKAVQTHQ